ncbi:MAG: hypothetical protein LBK95_12490 [Bifidobacteriaceae bacterium]|nr:hypothetical protein [Bifidobacteriaceae bacterium]
MSCAPVLGAALVVLFLIPGAQVRADVDEPGGAAPASADGAGPIDVREGADAADDGRARESMTQREIELGPMADADREDDSAPVQYDRWPEGCSSGDSRTPEELEFEFEHRFDGIEHGDVFTKRGVVVNDRYMDWYIEKVMMEREPMLAAQSSPFALIEGNEYYEALVAMGPAVIPEVERAMLNASYCGHSMYLFALALQELSGVDLGRVLDEPFGWANAGEFMDMWFPVRQTATEDVRAIVGPAEYTTDEKLEKIGYYGLLAVPALDELKNSPALDGRLKAGLRLQLESFGATDSKQAAQIAGYLSET